MGLCALLIEQELTLCIGESQFLSCDVLAFRATAFMPGSSVALAFKLINAGIHKHRGRDWGKITFYLGKNQQNMPDIAKIAHSARQ